jgi:hypothetical protein
MTYDYEKMGHGNLLGPEEPKTEESADASFGDINSDYAGESVDTSDLKVEEPKESFDAPEWEVEETIFPKPAFNPTPVETAVKKKTGKKLIILGVGLAALTILASTLALQIELNHQQKETLANYETQAKISEAEKEEYASRYEEVSKEASDIVAQVNAGTYGSTPESEAAGETIYSFANKIALKNKNLEDISEPQLNLFFRVSKYDLETVMGFTIGGTVVHDEYGRNYVDCSAPYESALSGIESGKYYIDSKTLVVNVPNALFTKEDGTVKAVTSDIPFVDAARDNGIDFDVTLTTYSSLSEYCEREGLSASTVAGAPLNGQPTSTKNYLTAENVEAIATRAYQDPGFEVMYSPNIAGNSYSQSFYSNNFFVAESYRMKYATAYWENGNSMAFYEVGGDPRAK